MATVQEAPLRQGTLFRSVDKLLKAHEIWVSDPNRPNPDDRYWDAVQDVIDQFDEGDIPGNCRALAELVEELAIQTMEFDERPNQGNLYPRDSFWACIEKLKQLRTVQVHPVRRKMESIKSLAALPNMQHEQVARMWNFIDARGNVMTWLVQKELDEPGSVLNNARAIIGPHWKHPDHAEGMEEPESAPVDERLDAKRKQSQQEDKPCPETPLELFRQGVSVEQAAAMLKKPLAEVEALWAEFDSAAGIAELEGGLEPADADPEEYQYQDEGLDLQEEDPEEDTETEESEASEGQAELPMDEVSIRARELTDEGKSQKAVAAELGISVRQVRNALGKS